MSIALRISFRPGELKAFQDKTISRAAIRAMRKASSTSLRDMRAEASKRVRARKRIKAKAIRKALVPRKNRGRTLDTMEWGVDVRGDTTRLSDYPHRQLKKGVKVEVNRGERTLIKGAFVATMGNGHKGVFQRKGAKRLPIKDRIASRPVDALLHEGEAQRVVARGRDSFSKTFDRLLPLELEKAKKR